MLRLLQRKHFNEFNDRKTESFECISENKWCRYGPILHNSLAYAVGVLSRLAEIGVRTTFIVLVLIAGLLFDTLGNYLENNTEIFLNNSNTMMSVELENWKNQYDLVCRFVEQINRVFGFFLLMITGHDFATCIFDFNNILEHLDLKDNLNVFQAYDQHLSHEHIFFNTESESFISMKVSPLRTCQFLHPIARFLFILVASHSVGVKVYT